MNKQLTTTIPVATARTAHTQQKYTPTFQVNNTHTRMTLTAKNSPSRSTTYTHTAYKFLTSHSFILKGGRIVLMFCSNACTQLAIIIAGNKPCLLSHSSIHCCFEGGRFARSSFYPHPIHIPRNNNMHSSSGNIAFARVCLLLLYVCST